MGTVTATCVTQGLQARTSIDDTPTGIDKAGVDGLDVTVSGGVGDQVLDLAHHGGRDKALYAYADEDAAWWAERLEQDVPPGRFGENLRLEGVDVGAAVIGTRWRLGTQVVVEVTEPRVPCSTFQHHMGDRPGWVKDFTAANRTGTYLRVLAPGRVAPGDEVTVVRVPDHGVTIAGWFGGNEPADARALLDAAEDGELDLATTLAAYARSVVARAG